MSLPGGSTAVLAGDNTTTPSFTADQVGTYEVQLIVTDEGALASAPDSVTISSDNLAPTAAAGDDQLVIAGDLVSLDGSGSTDPEDDDLAYAWTITAAPAESLAMLSGAATVSPTLTPDVEGVYTITLVVSDLMGPGLPDMVEITATTAEEFAETQIVLANGVVTLLGLGDVRNQGNQQAFSNFLTQAIVAIQEGEIDEAIDKLGKAIARTDGCPLRGSPDGNGPGRDWITVCAAQSMVYELLDEALDAIMP